MLIKLILDASLQPSQHQLTGNVAVWILQEQLPLQHPQNATALSNALGFPKGTCAIEIKTYTFVTGTNSHLDTRKTGKELGLTPGQQLVLCFHKPEPLSPSGSMRLTPRTQSTSSPPQSPRGNDRVRLASMAPQGNDEDEGTDAEQDDEEEIYHAKECGWMPFVVKTKQHRSLVTFMDPFQPIGETDRTPPMQELCEQCASCVAGADPLRVVVDRHYRPTTATQEVIEGWVEKLGGSTFARWQKRYLTITEKSLDWFVNKPTLGEKKKITGHRLFVRDGQVLLNGVNDKPDHPKCRDEPYFYFSVAFKDGQQGDKDMYFRVDNAKERSLYVNFLRLCESRMRSRSVNRNPVYWKRWVDAFLSNASDLGALHASNVAAAATFEAEIEVLEGKLASVRAERPGADQALAERAAAVQAQLREIASKESRIADADAAIRAAQGKVTLQEDLLRQKQLELGDEITKFRMLEQHTASKRSELEATCVALTDEIQRLRERHNTVFSKWRKLEERPPSPALNASQLLAVAASSSATASRLAIVGARGGRSLSPNHSAAGAPSTSLTPSRWSGQNGGRSPDRRAAGGIVERLSFSPSPAAAGSSAPPKYVSPSRVDLRAAATAARLAFSSGGGGKRRSAAHGESLNAP